jgi:hypothetical protein
LRDNKKSIEALNQWVEENGSFRGFSKDILMEQYCAYENTEVEKALSVFISLQHPVAAVLQHVLVAPVIVPSHFPTKSRQLKFARLLALVGKPMW